MPIEGCWNTVKAFFLTEAHLEESDRRNTFANGSLWYVQYFFGRETIEQKQDKFYFVLKPETSEHASWIPSCLKTVAYFVSALVWIIPGIAARFWSLDSEDVTDAIFADRITEPPKQAREVPRPVSLTAPPTAAPALPPAPVQISPLPTIPASAAPASSIAPAKISSYPATPAPKPKKAPLPAVIARVFKVDPAARATTDINHHRILNEFEFSVDFFTIFNASDADKEQIAAWLKIQQLEPSYRQPFLFGTNLQAAFRHHREKILKIIPEKDMSEWSALFVDAIDKLQKLGLTADQVEFLEEKPKLQQEKKTKGFVGTLKSIFSLEKSSETSELNALADYIIEFYAILRLESSRAKWLQSEGMEAWYFSPFFNALYLQAWTHPSLDPHKLKRLAVSHKICVDFLYKEGLEHHLTEIPNNLSPGLCALIHSVTQDLIQCPASFKNVTRHLPIPDDLNQQLIIKGIEPIAYLSGMQAILTTPRHFQRNKYKLLWFLDMMWAGYTLTLNQLLEMRSSKKDVLQWIEENKKSNIILAFSVEYKKLIDTLQPILDESIYKSWNAAYTQSVKKLKSYGLSKLTEGPLPAQDSRIEEIVYAKKFMNLSIMFFEQFLPIPAEKSEVWLAQEASKTGYAYPFFHSLDLNCKKERLKAILDPASISKWETLYQQACSKLQDLGLTHYLDEIPSRYFERLIELMTEKVISRLTNESSAAPSQPFLSSTKGIRRSPNSNSGN